MNSSPATTTTKRATWHGAPLLHAGPFIAWLDELLTRRRWGYGDVAGMVGCHERRVRAVFALAHVAELTVERWGIALVGDPRLAAQLYPELDFS